MLEDWRWTYFAEGIRAGLPLTATLYLGAVLLARRGGRFPGLVGTVIVLAFVSTPVVAARPISDLIGQWVSPGRVEYVAIPFFLLLVAGAFLPGQLLQALAVATVGGIALALHRSISVEPTLAVAALAATLPAAAVACSWIDERGAVVGGAIGLLGPSIFAIYLAVPDTEEAFALVGAAAPAVAAGLLPPRLRLGGAGTAATLLLMAWVTLVGSAGRGSAIVAASVSITALCAVPIAAALAPRVGVRLTRGQPGTMVILAIHAFTVIGAARLLPRLPGERSALLLAAGLIVAEIACILLGASVYARRSLDSVD